MTPEEARRQARLEFGGVEGVKEACREARGTLWLESLWRDLRLALRTLRASPAFTIAAVCTLALGIGANTAIFGLVDAVRLRSLPVSRPGELVRIGIHGRAGWGISKDDDAISFALWRQIQEHHKPFSGLVAWYADNVRVGERGESRTVDGLLVSGDYFDVLGVPPAAGRLFRGEDDQRACASPGVVLSHAFWLSHYAGRQSAIDAMLPVEGHRYQIVGVAPASFTGLEVGQSFDVALPICSLLALQPDNDFFTRTDEFWLTALARLAPGWTIAQANDYLRSTSPALFAATAPSGYSSDMIARYRGFWLEVTPASNGVSHLRQQYSASLSLLLGLTGLVLLIACANLANLMLARAAAKQREFAVRLALGASRARLAQQSLCESLVLAAGGTMLGVALAVALGRTILRFVSTADQPVSLAITPDWRMFAFVAAAAVCSCVVFGLLPSLRAVRLDPAESIKTGGRGVTGDRRRFSFQRTLVAIQIAVCLVLVVGALLFVRSFRNLMTMDLGFRRDGILLAYFDASALRLTPAAAKTFEQQLLDDVRAMPGVDSAATTTNAIVGGGMWHLGVHAGNVDNNAAFTWVSPGHFTTLGTPLLAGRDFNDRDREGAPNVAIVSQAFARMFFGGANPVGRTFRTAPEPNYPATLYLIVGMVKDTRYHDLRRAIEPMVWAPQAQREDPNLAGIMYIRSSAPPGVLIPDLQRRLTRAHPGLGVDFSIFRQQIDRGLVRDRLLAALSGFFGVLAMLLAGVGLYGVIAYIVLWRRSEIGIRMALGATRRGVIALVMRDTAALLAIGLACGVICALALASTASSLLFDLNARDPLTYVLAAAVLAVVAAIGSWLPAHRASRLDPMAALRCD